MKKINRGFLFYLGILFAVVLAGFLICVVIIVLCPGTSIFGLNYYKVRNQRLFDKMTIYSAALDDSGNTVYTESGESVFAEYKDLIKNVVIKSNAHYVTVQKANETFTNADQWQVSITNSTTGFAKKKVEEPQMSAKYFVDTNTLEISANVPEGFWITGNSSSIKMQIPKSVDESKYNLFIEAGNGSVLLGDAESSSNPNPSSLIVRSAKISAKSLNVTEYAYLGVLNAFEGETVLNIKENISVSSAICVDVLTINSGSGNSSFRPGAVAIMANRVLIETKNSTTNYGNVIVSDEIMLKGVYGTQTFGVIDGNVNVLKGSKKCDYNFETINGNLNVGSAEQDGTKEVKVESCDIRCSNPIGGVKDIHTTGKVEIPD